MTTDLLLNAAQAFWDNVSDVDGGYGQRRTRLLLYAQQANDEIRHEQEWQWEQGSATGTISPNTSTLALPSDYEELGNGGGFFVSSSASAVDGGYAEVEEKSVEEISTFLRTVSTGSNLPPIFAIYGDALNFPPSSSSIYYKLIFSKSPLVLTDTAQAIRLPARYHHTVLLPALVSRMQEAKGDVRENWEQRYMKGLSKMKKRERPRKTVVQQLPTMVDEYQW